MKSSETFDGTNENRLIEKFSNVKKLFTKEDTYDFHKICGLMSIISYIIHFYIFYSNKQMHFNYFLLLFNFLLHLASFSFKVLDFKSISYHSSAFIWREYRIHSMLFAYRAIFIILFKSPIIISFFTMILADIATYYYGTPNITTVRFKNHDKKTPVDKLKIYYFVTSQIGATLLCMGLFQNEINLGLIFSTLPAIQLGAFGLTLIRKNLISYKSWALGYSLFLLNTQIMVYSTTKSLHLHFIGYLLYFVRIYIKSKYVMWGLLVALDYLLRYKYKFSY